MGLSLKGRALKCLAAREHSRLELTRKLAPHAETPEQVDQALDDLQAKGLLSNERFAESMVRRKAARFGTARLKAELAQHRLSAEITQPITQQLQATEFERAQALWQRRFGELPDSLEARAKQMRFLAGRGFSGEVIRQVMRRAMRHAESGEHGWED